MQLTHSPRGFTLMELGVVIAITAILSAAFLPDFLEAARTRMTERAVEDVALIHDAATFFYVKQLDPVWPAQAGASCSPAADPLQTLFAGGYYGRSAPTNPWARPYVASLEQLPGTVDGCLFKVSTLIPDQLTGYFSGRVKQGGCDRSICGTTPAALNTPALTAGFTHCCAFAARPSTGVVAGCLPPRKLVYAAGQLRCQ
ncbi:MAG: prepilin-type N-terminal cleavage/methylation domain-containing protein [Deltaproteobacteria bacterium]|nr:prepilin-type N-terminal cleavage/methylation domain-containing protein [Deltaproteobacteria bacterium]